MSSDPYVVNAMLPSPGAARKFRLVNFTSSFEPKGYKLMPEHEAKLDELAAFVSRTTSFFYWIIAFASKRGDAGANKRLSSNRALSVQKFLSSKNPSFADDDRLAMFDWLGEEGYKSADADDNSYLYRAVELHLFLGNVKPVPPPDIKPLPPSKPPLPGGQRYKKWQVGAVFGLQVPIPGLSVGPAGVHVAANIFNFKKTEGGEEKHTFLGLGPGVGVSLPALGALKNLGKAWDVITAPSWSGYSFSDPVDADTAFNFGDLSGADVLLGQAGAGLKPPSIITPFGSDFVPTGYQFARLNVSGKLWHYDSAGMPFFKEKDMLSNVDVGGPQAALGAGVAGQANKLIFIK